MKLDFLVTVDWDYYQKFMSVNMDGALLCTRAVYQHDGQARRRRHRQPVLHRGMAVLELLRPGQGRHQRPDPAAGPELGGQNIRINAIAPGPIDTEATRTTTPQEMVADIVKRIPLSRMGTPEDLVGMCLFLLSDQAEWITGQIFNVDGGQIIR